MSPARPGHYTTTPNNNRPSMFHTAMQVPLVARKITWNGHAHVNAQQNAYANAKPNANVQQNAKPNAHVVGRILKNPGWMRMSWHTSNKRRTVSRRMTTKDSSVHDVFPAWVTRNARKRCAQVNRSAWMRRIALPLENLLRVVYAFSPLFLIYIFIEIIDARLSNFCFR